MRELRYDSIKKLSIKDISLVMGIGLMLEELLLAWSVIPFFTAKQYIQLVLTLVAMIIIFFIARFFLRISFRKNKS